MKYLLCASGIENWKDNTLFRSCSSPQPFPPLDATVHEEWGKTPKSKHASAYVLQGKTCEQSLQTPSPGQWEEGGVKNSSCGLVAFFQVAAAKAQPVANACAGAPGASEGGALDARALGWAEQEELRHHGHSTGWRPRAMDAAAPHQPLTSCHHPRRTN